MCSFCDIQNAAPINIFSDEEIERIVIGVYSGLITPQSLDVATYTKVAEKLTNGVYNGFGKALTDVEWNSPDFKMLNDLRNNVYVFSGAKQYHQVREMTEAIYDKDRIKPFSEYKKTGTDIFKNYNETRLRAEYNAAISQSRSASMWMEIESNAELLPMLTYSTVGDGRVRPEHAMLNNISRPVNDRFWDNYFPPNGWNCRCTVLQTDSEDKTSLKGFKRPDTVPDVFMMNAGKDRIVFSDAHPHFTVAPKDRDLASNNFNMPKPKMEMPKISTPVKSNEFVPAKDIKEAEQRILQLGVKNVNLKGLEDNNLFNSVLKAVEKEHSINPLNIDNLKTVNRPKSNFKAVYLQEQDRKTREVLRRDININLHHLKDFKHTPLKSYQDILIEQKQRLLELNSKDANGGYTENMKQYLISQVERNIKDYEKRIADGLNPKWFSTSSMETTPSESLHTTMIHELGHHRHELIFKESGKEFTMSNTITQYSGTNKMEYFAEWYSTYRKNGASGVPDDMLKLFKIIDNGK